ncbi:uncharacterized protein LOC131299096 isoform X2 [Rhododendron vialii]|uniref:uncharacterized protein LOC131299096 isoform X2 n=1 Tax=Rhododendron vialii TaxID=182163 RepID=UPI00265E04EE|nr:uncharacterized protein LOC131299096 isoform X2 [Rhododendron vialii]
MEVSRECEIGLTSPQELDTLWFLIFKVADFSSKITFSFEVLRNISIPPPCHVKHLKLSGRSYRVGVLNLDALVDGLPWSCRPETLSIAEAPDIGTKFAKALCEKLVSQKSRQRCCGSSPVACWLHCLKDVKIALLAGTDKKALDCHSLLQALPTLIRHHHISFNFRW